MLTLSRKAKESIRIDDEITLTVLEVQGDKVVVGIAAPPDRHIRRTELPVILPFAPGEAAGDVDLDTEPAA